MLGKGVMIFVGNFVGMFGGFLEVGFFYVIGLEESFEFWLNVLVL